MTDNLHFGGVPTEPDVRRIRHEYPDHELRAGQIIRYEAVENIIGAQRDSNRFSTVTARWRKAVEADTGTTIIGTEPGVGFKVLTEPEKLELGHQKLRSAARAARRSYLVSGRISIDQLKEEDRRRLEVLQHRNAAVISAAQMRSKAQLPEFGKDNR